VRFIRLFVLTIATAVAALATADVCVDAFFPHLPRLADNFSAAYLRRDIASLDRRATVYLGDSALWGYGISADEAATTLLKMRGINCENLSYEGGSPANSDAMLRILLAAGVKPHALVFNVNQKEFNVADSAYQKLYPEVERLSWNELPPPQRAMLSPTLKHDVESSLDGTVASAWT